MDTRHESYLSSQHFYTIAALCDGKTASGSKVEGVRSIKVARILEDGLSFMGLEKVDHIIMVLMSHVNDRTLGSISTGTYN